MKFTPVFKDKIWGGNKIRSVLDINFGNLPNCGEAWMISGLKNNETLVENGFLAGNPLNDLVEIYMGDLVGDKVFEEFGNEFPLLIKFLDTNAWLSIQVHPDDELASKRKLGRGKTEMWYVLEAEKNAELILGFNKKVTKEEYIKLLKNKMLQEVLNYEKVEKDDAFFIPSGRIHSLGPGLLLAEIQQSSDITYRIYDWDRIDAAGMRRELHTEQALDAIDFNVYENYKTNYLKKINQTVNIIDSQYFTTNILSFNKSVSKNYEELDSFVIYMIVEGEMILKNENDKLQLKKGEVVLLPNIIENVELHPHSYCKVLEIYIE
jgi:mannose-6-phosphate isomerase